MYTLKSYIYPLFFLLIFSFTHVFSQTPSKLSIEKIMQGEKFTGISPSNIHWSEDGSKIFFDWNPEGNLGDSLYVYSLATHKTTQVSPAKRRALPSQFGVYNRDHSLKLYTKDGDVFLYSMKNGTTKQLTNTIQRESNISFSQNEKNIIFQTNSNLYTWNIEKGNFSQLTNFIKGSKNKKNDVPIDENKAFLYNDQLTYFQILKERKEKAEARKKTLKSNKLTRPKAIYLGSKSIDNIMLSPDGKFVTYRLSKSAHPENTKVPNYVTESGNTEELIARSNVGRAQTTYETEIYDIKNDTAYLLKTEMISGIYDIPDFLKAENEGKSMFDKERETIVHGPIWSDNGEKAIIVVRSIDNKDRWIMQLDLATGKPKLLDRQTDQSWIGGPGISSWNFTTGSIGWLPDNNTIWLQSEKSGYSHLCSINIKTGKKKTLTKGKYEIYNPQLSKDKQYFYFSSNEVHSGERHFYKMSINGGKRLQITSATGRNDVSLSPDESKIAVLHSFANQPTELYLATNNVGDKPKRITDSQTDKFKSYTWRTPEFITFKASDGAVVNARIYQPEDSKKTESAIIFVHGAGYLQNAHKWWSSYYREYMFHNFLVDNGYTVLDIDYRGSAGYGRDWRTGIYRFMGGKDLDDQIDGAKLLVEKYNIDSKKIGIYGGSYGGFITIMAQFTKPGTFKAGAALRSVTDWAHYNHEYTSNILNTPVQDSIAYAKSSPIYYAEGLQDALLMCHGVIDTNVHFQDVVRLSQRLIELGKDDWELAVYPLEGHGFKEPSSWTDEYKRIFKLFEENLK